MSKRPFFVVGTASFLCALLCSGVSLTGILIVLIACVSIGVIGFAFRRTRPGHAALLAAVAALIVGGAFLAKLCLTVYPQMAYAEHTVQVTMRIQDTETHSSGRAYIVETENGDIGHGVKLYLWPGDLGVDPKVGDLLTGKVYLSAAFDDRYSVQERFAKASGVWLYAQPAEECVLIWSDGRDSMPLTDRLLTMWREGIQSVLYTHLPSDNAALCESMLMGERDRLPSDTAFYFRVCGVYHILAVSGLHLVVIVGVVQGLTKRLPRRVSTVISMVATLLFMMLCGWTASVTRAGCTMLIALSAGLFRRRADGLNSLGMAAAIMLLADPFCVYDVGWQLSFAAVLGLLVMMPVWQREVTERITETMPLFEWIVSPLLTAVGTSLCATVTTHPISALYFGELSTIFLPCNVVCVPMSTLLLVLILLAVAVCSLIPWLGKWLFMPIDRLCDWLEWFTARMAELPFATISTAYAFVIVWLFALPIMMAAAYRFKGVRGVVRGTALMLCALFTVCILFRVIQFNTVTVTVVPTSAPVVIVETDDSRGVIFAGDERALQGMEASLNAKGISHLEWALWLETTDTRQCSSVLNTITIDRLMITADASSYQVLPKATLITCVDETTILFSEGKTLELKHRCCRLNLGDTTVLVCGSDADLQNLDKEWKETHLLILPDEFLADVTQLSADHTVACCSAYTLESSKLVLPHTFSPIYFTAQEDELEFITRQKGDMSLQGR